MTYGNADMLRRDPARLAETTLKAAAVFWYLVAVTGQLIFVVYIVGFYGASAVQGDFEVWNKVLPHGIIPGDTMGNIAIDDRINFYDAQELINKENAGIAIPAGLGSMRNPTNGAILNINTGFGIDGRTPT